LLKLDADKLRQKLEPHINIDSRLSTLRDIVREFCLEEGIPI
jgi:phosphotransferase system enzyme I (PtsP)